ncbi:hypothetical protein MMC18_007745 [Xylographa bjoerkii]|nr:hypothetical protein [Xylographa bjoerkii]
MDPVSAFSIATAAIGFIQNINSIVNWIQDTRNAREDHLRWLGDLEALIVLFKTLQVRAEAAEGSELSLWFYGFFEALKDKDGEIAISKEADGTIKLGGLFGRLQEKIELLQDKLNIKHGWRGIKQRVRHSNDKGDIKNDYADIRALKADLDSIMQYDHFTLSLNIKRQLDTLLAAQEVQESRARNEEELKILKWLSPLEFLERQRKIFSECFYNASVPPGQWLLESEEFVAWKTGTRDRPWPLYYHGKPGAGKTVLSSIVVDHLQSHCKDHYRAEYTKQAKQLLKLSAQHRKELGVGEQLEVQRMTVLYLYLNYKETKVQTFSHLIGSLLKQLIQGQELGPLPDSVKELYASSKGELRPGDGDVIGILKSEVEAKFKRVYLVVDALDEFPENDRQDLLNNLRDISSERISLLITSRTSDDITHEESMSCNNCWKKELCFFFECQGCKDFTLCKSCMDEDIWCDRCDPGNIFKEPAVVAREIIVPDAEIKRYVEWNLEKQRGLGSDWNGVKQLGSGSIAQPRLAIFLQSNPELITEIPKAIVSKASGMFLLAKLHLESLKFQDSPAKVKRALKKLSTDVTKIYRDVLDRIEDQRSSEVELAKRTLYWLVLVHRPLSVSELRQALAVEPQETEFDPDNETNLAILFRVTSGLITADADQGAVRVVHRTAQEYFEDNWKELFPKAQTDIAVTILTYLNLDAFAIPVEGDEEDVEVDKRLEKFSFLAYASTYWGEHVQTVLDATETRTQVMKFLKDPARLESTIQAAWQVGSKSQTSASWDVRAGINGLHVCAWYGLDFALTALTETLDINSQDTELGQTPLMYACRQGHTMTVSKLLELGADVNVKSFRGSNALFEAVLHKHSEVLHTLLTTEAPGRSLDINMTHPGKGNTTALMLAASAGLKDTVTLLLERPQIAVNAQDTQGWTALAHAAFKDDCVIVKRLLNAPGIEVDLPNDNGATPLIVAAEHGHTEIVAELLGRHADPEYMQFDGTTAILHAINNGYHLTVEVILEHGINIHTKDGSGRTLLHRACMSDEQQVEIVRLLLDRGLDINARGDRGETPLHDASRCGYLEIVEFLLKSHADPSLKDASSQQRTPLIAAWQNGKTDIVSLLQASHGSTDKEPVPSDASLPLWSLAKLGKTDLIRNVIQDPKQRQPYSYIRDPDTNNTALHWTILHHEDGGSAVDESVSILGILLDADMSPNEVNDQKRTPLHLAAYIDHYSAAQMLLASKTKPDLAAQDMWGKTSLRSAQPWYGYNVAVLIIGAALSNTSNDVTPAIDIGDPSTLLPTFFAAIQLSNVPVVSLLIARGADVRARNKDNQTALQIAKQRSSDELLRVLRESIFGPAKKSELGKKSALGKKSEAVTDPTNGALVQALVPATANLTSALDLPAAPRTGLMGTEGSKVAMEVGLNT